jgi:hypothetical protein
LQEKPPRQLPIPALTKNFPEDSLETAVWRQQVAVFGWVFVKAKP